MLNDEDIEYIERYFKSELSDKELKHFNERVQNEEEFSAEVKFMKDLSDGLMLVDIENIKTTISELQAKEFDIRSKKSNDPRKNFKVAASVLVLVGLAYFSFLFTQPNGEMKLSDREEISNEDFLDYYAHINPDLKEEKSLHFNFVRSVENIGLPDSEKVRIISLEDTTYRDSYYLIDNTIKAIEIGSLVSYDFRRDYHERDNDERNQNKRNYVVSQKNGGNALVIDQLILHESGSYSVIVHSLDHNLMFEDTLWFKNKENLDRHLRIYWMYELFIMTEFDIERINLTTSKVDSVINFEFNIDNKLITIPVNQSNKIVPLFQE